MKKLKMMEFEADLMFQNQGTRLIYYAALQPIRIKDPKIWVSACFAVDPEGSIILDPPRSRLGVPI